MGMNLGPHFTWTNYDITLRDDLLDRVFGGEITPEQAEKEASEAGVGPLATRPNSADFDPMKEVWWTLPMVAAWIGWRTTDAVRTAWSIYSNKVWIWKGPTTRRVPINTGKTEAELLLGLLSGESVPVGWKERTGYLLQNQTELTLFEVILRSTYGTTEMGTPLIVGEQLRSELWQRLASRQLIAEGIPDGGGARAPIRDAEWIDLIHYDHEGWPTDAIGVRNQKLPSYLAVRARRVDVLSIWPHNDLHKPATETFPSLQRNHLQSAIRQTFDELWPEGVPIGKMVQQRDSEIIQEMKKKGLKTPASRTISRALKGG